MGKYSIFKKVAEMWSSRKPLQLYKPLHSIKKGKKTERKEQSEKKKRRKEKKETKTKKFSAFDKTRVIIGTTNEIQASSYTPIFIKVLHTAELWQGN